MVWLRNFDMGTVNPGPGGCPQTTFSFDDQNAHFVVLNEYCDLSGDTVTDGDIPDHLYEWLEQDLALHQRPFIFVIGHEPAYPSPDMLSGRLRHAEDSLNIHVENRDRFWRLLRASRVTAYICGHTHNYSRVQIEGVWQVDAGHARGAGDMGSASTMIVMDTGGTQAQMNTYRAVSSPDVYSLADSGLWLSRTMTYFPLISR
jgi:predicted phosphodiesterase